MNEPFSFLFSSANATPVFEGRGGEELAAEIGNILTRTYGCPSCFDLEALCIIPEEQCWILYVDVLVSLIRNNHIYISNVIRQSCHVFMCINLYVDF